MIAVSVDKFVDNMLRVKSTQNMLQGMVVFVSLRIDLTEINSLLQLQ